MWKALMSKNNNNKWLLHNPEPVLENETHKLLRDFEIKTDHPISARQPDLLIVNKRKRNCQVVEFAVPANHRANIKESEKRDKYHDLARELKKLSNMKVSVIPIMICALRTVLKGLVKELED